MAFGLIPSWQIDGGTVETMADFIFWGSKITADDDCSHEIKKFLLLGRKVMTNLDSILKSRHITLPTKVRLVKAMVFPVVMYGCESWTIKKAECQRIDAFELWCWRRLLRVLWTARRSNQSILKKTSPEYSLEGLDSLAEAPILWWPDVKNWLIGKDPNAGKDWKLEKGMTEDEMVWWHHQLNRHESEWTPGVGDGQGSLACCSPWGYKESDMTERLDWTELSRTKDKGRTESDTKIIEQIHLAVARAMFKDTKRWRWWLRLGRQQGPERATWHRWDRWSAATGIHGHQPSSLSQQPKLEA